MRLEGIRAFLAFDDPDALDVRTMGLMMVELRFLLRFANGLPILFLAGLDPAVNDSPVRVGAVLGLLPIGAVAVGGEASETADAAAIPTGFEAVICAGMFVVVLMSFAVQAANRPIRRLGEAALARISGSV